MGKQLPNYKDGSIVNLMSSIARSLGAKTKYGPLKGLSIDELKKSKNIVLIIVDGVGADIVNSLQENNLLKKHKKMEITSVFPPTTAAAITTFMTGKAPNEHGVLSWFLYSKELGGVIRPLPFDYRFGGVGFAEMGVDSKKFYNLKSFFDLIKVKGFSIKRSEIINSSYSIAVAGKSKRIGFNGLDSFFTKIKKTVKIDHKKKYICAYIDDFDSNSHQYGKKSSQAKRFLKQFEQKLGRFLKQIVGTNTTIIITADHGHMYSKKKTKFRFENFKELYDCLVLPMSGEKRACFCHLKAGREKLFKKLVKKHLGKYCELHSSKSLLKSKLFGLYKTHEKVPERLGDYVILFKEGCSIADVLFDHKPSNHVSDHGGISKEEMIVPLILIKSE